MWKGWQKWIQALGNLKHLHFKRKALIVATKAFGRIQYTFMIKFLRKLGIQRNFFNVIKSF